MTAKIKAFLFTLIFFMPITIWIIMNFMASNGNIFSEILVSLFSIIAAIILYSIAVEYFKEKEKNKNSLIQGKMFQPIKRKNRKVVKKQYEY